MKKTSIALICSISGIAAITPLPLHAAATPGASARGDVQSVAEREVARRQEYINRAQEYIANGDKAMKDHDYETAISNYKTVCDTLPISSASNPTRNRALDGYCNAGVKFAEQRIAEGRFQDAEIACKNVLEPAYNPNCSAAKSLLAKLADPTYFNRTITPKLHADVEKIKQLMTEANGFYQTGKYDLAFKRYEQVLNIDPYNIAARKGEEKVNNAKADYAIEGYNQTRSNLLGRVQKSWDLPVRKFGNVDNGFVQVEKTDQRGTQRISEKLARIQIPKIEFKNATIREAIDFLKAKSKELDVTEPDPTRRGVNIVLKIDSAGAAPAPAAALPAADPAAPAADPAAAVALDPAAAAAPMANPNDATITLSLSNVPLVEALNYVTKLANLKYKLDPYAVFVVPISEPTETLITKEYKVPPGFISNSPGAGAETAGLAATTKTTTAGDATRGGTGIIAKQPAKDFLAGAGVNFPPGAYANYFSSSSRLVVRNTQDNLDLVDTLVDIAVSTGPMQVEIEAKFVEITQQNLKELSFNWLVGASSIPGTSGKVFAAGGTPGNTSAVPGSSDYPLPINNLQPTTGGLRSGANAISANAIDALIFPSHGASLAAPAVLGVAGVLTDPKFVAVMRALNQKKGVDLLSAPRVTTKSGQRAVIEIIREFIYPTTFEPPQVDKQGGGGNGRNNVGLGNTPIQIPTVTPTTPTGFTTRNTGVTMEVEPTVGPDKTTIDLNLVPQVVEFEGFINYGSPIQTVNPAAFETIPAIIGAATGASQSVTLTDNVINQPIFSTRKVTTSVSVWDGQTVVLGGLIREDVQKVEDKVPLFGDIPLVGRLFRSQVDQHLKRNLIIFVTAKLVNPAGDAIHLDEDKEEVVEPIAQPEALQPAPLPEMPLFSK